MKQFQETLYEHFAQIFTVDEVLHRSRTRFQDVLIFRNRIFGKVLALDGIVQLTELDNHIYHEMIAHVPLFAHGYAKSVLIVGGGDGGVLKEVLKHPVSKVVVAELDGEVIELSRRYLPEISAGAYDDKRVSVVVGDATEYVARSKLTFDVIIVDSTDPIGPGERLFEDTFYGSCTGLLRPNGIVAVQSGAPFFQQAELRSVCSRLTHAFGAARPYLAPVPTYAGGMLALVAASSVRDRLRPPTKVLRERFLKVGAAAGYYTPEVHRAAFTLPPSFSPSS